jgi:prepilin-type N-terminal cleavage/methylation domain-containing protein
MGARTSDPGLLDRPNAETHMKQTSQHPRRGVTMIEMMIVVVLLSLVSALALPKLNFAQFKTDDSVRAVRTALQTAQRLAITRQFDVIVSFDTTKQQIRIVEDLNNNYAIDAGERVTYVPLDQGVKFAAPAQGGVVGPVSASVVGTNVLTISGLPSVVFLRSGSASSYVEVYLTANGNDGGSEWRSVQVTQATGRTVWYRWLVNLWSKASV